MKNNGKIYFLMVLASFFWAGAFVAGKLSVPYIPVFSLTFFRFLLATMVLYVVRKKSKLWGGYEFSNADIPVFLFTGIVGMVFYHLFFFTALSYTTAINSSIIAAMNPVITVIIGYLFVKQKITFRMLIGILISFAGVMLTITGGEFEVFEKLKFNPGDIIMLVAVISWASYSVFSRTKGGRFSAIVLTYYSFLVCTIICFPLFLTDKPWQWLDKVPLIAIVAVIYMSIFASVAGYLIQQMSIRQIGTAKTSIFVNLVPVFSIALSTIILGEEVKLIKIITAAIIISGVYICQTSGRALK